MAISKAQAVFLDTLVERCESFVAEITAIKELDYPSDAPQILATCLFDAAGRINNRAHELRQAHKQTNAIPIDEIMAEASNIYDFVVFNSSYSCPMLRDASIGNVPAEMVLPMENIARLLFPDCQIIIGEVSEWNYYFREIGRRIIENFTNVDLDDILSQHESFPSELFRLQVCSNPPCGILLHCLLGHEIGHAIYNNQDLSRILLPHFSYDQRAFNELVDSRFQQLWEEFSRDTGRAPQLVFEQTRAFMEYITRVEVYTVAAKWIEELFCDIVGIGLFGPAFVSASSMFLLPFSQIDETSDSHPSSRLRIQWSISALERTDPGFGYRRLRKDSIQAFFAPLIDPWKEMVGTKPSVPRNAVHKIISDAVFKLKTKIIEAAKLTLGNNFYRPSSFKKEVPQLRKRIKNWLPPNEYQVKPGDAFDIAGLQGIFNSGWLSYIEDMPYFVKIFKRLSENEIKIRFYGLVLKGIESSQIQIRWQNAKDNLR